MNTRILRRLAVVLPLLFWVFILLIRLLVVGQIFVWELELALFLVFSLGAVLFSRWIFQVVEQRELEIKRRSEQLAALNEAALALSKELDLGTVLQKVVDLSRGLVQASYGALGVLGMDGTTLEQFVTSGMTEGQREAIGHMPHGRGLLGMVIREGRPLRVDQITQDPRSAGFPPNHPRMRTFLGVPIKSKGKVYGNLYLADKIVAGNAEAERRVGAFTDDDQHILEMFATQAAIAIENAQLYRQVQQLAVLEERERFGMDLHDGIIQSIYAIGLMLEDTQHRMDREPGIAGARLQRAIHDLNDVISDIRNYILDLRPQRFQGRDLNRGLEELAREIRANTFLNVHLDTDSVDVHRLSAEQTVEILHIAQEAMTNVRKHARATSLDITLRGESDHLVLTIQDDGIGLDSRRPIAKIGNGLRNMRERATSLKGEIRFDEGEQTGTCVRLRVPYQ